jgi:type I restriction enzyme, S subunit
MEMKKSIMSKTTTNMKKNSRTTIIARKYKPYPAYKDSGVEWLGEIPEGWDVIRSKALFSHRNEKATEGEEQLTASQNYGVIPQSQFMEKEGRRVVQVITGADILKHAEAGDFVISMRSFQGGIELSNYSGSISSAYVVLKPNPSVDLGYFSYLLKSIQYIQALQSTSNLVRDGQALRYQNFILVDLPSVPKEDQNRIASLLDRQTSKIDALAAKYQRLLELLAEKRSALISRAVTKGLDLKAPMKDSGVEWLGEIPEGWTQEKLKCLCRVTTGDKDTVNAIDDGEYPFFVRSQTVERINSYSYDGEAVLTAGDGAGVGKVFHYYKGKFDFHQRVYLMYSFSDCIYPIYFFFYIRELFAKVALDGSAKSTVDSLRMPVFLNFTFCFPSKPEQKKIIAYLDHETSKIDALVAKVERAVELLKEYRVALISAAVTGKIDLREESA